MKSCIAIIAALVGAGLSVAEVPVLQIGHSANPHRLTYSDDGKLLATQSRIGEVKIWNRESLSVLGTFSSLSGLARGVEFSPDNRYVAASVFGGSYLCDRVAGRVIHQAGDAKYLFGTKSGECFFITRRSIEQRSLPDFEKIAGWEPGEGFGLASAGFTSGSRLIVQLAPSGFVELNPKDLGKLADFPEVEVPMPNYSLIPMPNKPGFLIHRFEGIDLLDLTAEKPLVRPVLKGLRPSEPSVSRDGMLFATGILGGVEIYDTDTWKSLLRTPLQASVSAFAWSPDGAELAVVTEDDGIVFVDPRSGEKLASLAPDAEFPSYGIDSLPVAASPDGKVLALAGDDGLMRILRIGKSIEMAVAPSPEGLPEVVHAFDSRNIVTIKGSKCRLWECDGLGNEIAPFRMGGFQYGKNSRGMWFRKGKEVREINMIDGKLALSPGIPVPAIGAISISNDGQFLVAREVGEPNRWLISSPPDWETKRILPQGNLNGISSMMIHRPKTGTLYAVDLRAGLVKATPDADEWKKVVLEGGDELFALSAFSKDARRLAIRILGEKSGVAVVDIEKEAILCYLRQWATGEHSNYIEVLNFTSDSESLWACGPEGRPVLHKTETGEPLLRLTTWPDGSWVMETPDGDFDANPSGLDKIGWLDETLEQSVDNPDLIKAHHQPGKIKGILDKALR